MDFSIPNQNAKTTQATFDTVLAGLAKQDFQRSVVKESGICKLRGPNNCRCAVGLLIPDSVYSDELEGFLADESPVSEALIKLGYDPVLVRKLQYIHDGSEQPKTMRDRIKKFAEEHRLTIPEGINLNPAEYFKYF